jgi:hypothetical protein
LFGDKPKYSQLPDGDFRKELPEETEKYVRDVHNYLEQMETSISNYLTNVLERELTLCRLLPKKSAPTAVVVLKSVDWDMKRRSSTHFLKGLDL